jgi:hypothetical protein
LAAAMSSFGEAEVTGEAIPCGREGASVRYGATMIRLVKVVVLRGSMVTLGFGYNLLKLKEICGVLLPISCHIR